MNRFFAGCVIVGASHMAHAQAPLMDRVMAASPAICYQGAGSPQGIDQTIVSGLYAEVRNQGQSIFSPRLWLSAPLSPPYEISRANQTWQLCQDLAGRASKPVKQPYFSSDRPTWRGALLTCADASNDGRSACLNSLFAEMEKRKYGLMGAPSILVEGSVNYIIAPVVVPSPSPPQPATTSMPGLTAPPQPGGTAQ